MNDEYVKVPLIGRMLRTYREHARMTIEDAAAALGCDKSRISRIETGDRGLRPPDLRELLDVYGADPRVRDALMPALRAAYNGWWEDHPSTHAGLFRDYAPLEMAATRILSFHPFRVPALLQTEEYARARVGGDDAALRVAATLARQQAVLGRPAPPELVAIIGHRAFHDRQGPGTPPGQLDALAARQRGVTVQVAPASLESAAMPFTVLEFGSRADPAVALAYLPAYNGGVILDRPEQVAGYRATFTAMRAAALTPEQSAAHIRNLAAPAPAPSSGLARTARPARAGRAGRPGRPGGGRRI